MYEIPESPGSNNDHNAHPLKRSCRHRHRRRLIISLFRKGRLPRRRRRRGLLLARYQLRRRRQSSPSPLPALPTLLPPRPLPRKLPNPIPIPVVQTIRRLDPRCYLIAMPLSKVVRRRERRPRIRRRHGAGVLPKGRRRGQCRSLLLHRGALLWRGSGRGGLCRGRTKPGKGRVQIVEGVASRAAATAAGVVVADAEAGDGNTRGA